MKVTVFVPRKSKHGDGVVTKTTFNTANPVRITFGVDRVRIKGLHEDVEIPYEALYRRRILIEEGS